MLVLVGQEVAWHVELAVQPAQCAAFRALTTEMIRTAGRERGVLAYRRYLSEDATSAVVYEHYATSNAAVAHLNLFRERFAVAFERLAIRRRFMVIGMPSPALRTLLQSYGAIFLNPVGGF